MLPGKRRLHSHLNHHKDRLSNDAKQKFQNTKRFKSGAWQALWHHQQKFHFTIFLRKHYFTSTKIFVPNSKKIRNVFPLFYDFHQKAMTLWQPGEIPQQKICHFPTILKTPPRQFPNITQYLTDTFQRRISFSWHSPLEWSTQRDYIHTWRNWNRWLRHLSTHGRQTAKYQMTWGVEKNENNTYIQMNIVGIFSLIFLHLRNYYLDEENTRNSHLFFPL